MYSTDRHFKWKCSHTVRGAQLLAQGFSKMIAIPCHQIIAGSRELRSQVLNGSHGIISRKTAWRNLHSLVEGPAAPRWWDLGSLNGHTAEGSVAATKDVLAAKNLNTRVVCLSHRTWYHWVQSIKINTTEFEKHFQTGIIISAYIHEYNASIHQYVQSSLCVIWIMRCDFQHLVMFCSLRCHMLTTRRWVHVQLDDFASASATLAVALAALALATGVVILALGSSHGQSNQVVNWAQLRSQQAFFVELRRSPNNHHR